MRRHLIPHADAGGWSGDGLTQHPRHREPYVGLDLALRRSLGKSTTYPAKDAVQGYVLCVQWFGIILEIAIGRVR